MSWVYALELRRGGKWKFGGSERIRKRLKSYLGENYPRRVFVLELNSDGFRESEDRILQRVHASRHFRLYSGREWFETDASDAAVHAFSFLDAEQDGDIVLSGTLDSVLKSLPNEDEASSSSSSATATSPVDSHTDSSSSRLSVPVSDLSMGVCIPVGSKNLRIVQEATPSTRDPTKLVITVECDVCKGWLKWDTDRLSNTRADTNYRHFVLKDHKKTARHRQCDPRPTEEEDDDVGDV